MQTRTALLTLAGCVFSSFAQSGVLTPQEEADLIFMREEEKVARDVYLDLFTMHGAIQFSNIAASEQNHMNAVGNLIDRYALADPVVDDTPGAFTAPLFSSLYTDLTTRGHRSLADAFRVGLDIEKLDISDLDAAIGRTTRTDITNVYTNLLNGSLNHLAAFRAAYDSVAGCRADLGEDGVLDLNDINDFVNAFVGGDPLADLAAPQGVLDLSDVSSFVDGFLAGCP